MVVAIVLASSVSVSGIRGYILQLNCGRCSFGLRESELFSVTEFDHLALHDVSFQSLDWVSIPHP